MRRALCDRNHYRVVVRFGRSGRLRRQVPAGRPQRPLRRYAAVHPAAILIYKPAHATRAGIDELKALLVQAGHRSRREPGGPQPDGRGLGTRLAAGRRFAIRGRWTGCSIRRRWWGRHDRAPVRHRSRGSDGWDGGRHGHTTRRHRHGNDPSRRLDRVDTGGAMGGVGTGGGAVVTAGLGIPTRLPVRPRREVPGKTNAGSSWSCSVLFVPTSIPRWRRH